VTLKVTAPAGFSLRAAAAGKGVSVRVKASVAGRIAVVANGGALRVARSAGTVRANTTATLRLRISNATARTLKRRHVRRVTVSIALTPTGSRHATTRTASLRLVR
jgi:hypothetical protein